MQHICDNRAMSRLNIYLTSYNNVCPMKLHSSLTIINIFMVNFDCYAAKFTFQSSYGMDYFYNCDMMLSLAFLQKGLHNPNIGLHWLTISDIMED